MGFLFDVFFFPFFFLFTVSCAELHGYIGYFFFFVVTLEFFTLLLSLGIDELNLIPNTSSTKAQRKLSHSIITTVNTTIKEKLTK